MSYQFKKGDVVRYKKDQISYMPVNGHGESNHLQEFVVESTNYLPEMGNAPFNQVLVKFKGDGPNGGVLAHRIELVSLAKGKQGYNFAWGVFLADGSLCQAFKTRLAARDLNKFGCYQIKKIKYEIV